MAKYLRGDLGSLAVIRAHADAVLGPLEHRDLGWPYQCRCGSTIWVRYHGRFYSPCGIWWEHPDAPSWGDHPTLRQRWDERGAEEGRPHDRPRPSEHARREEHE